MDKTRSGSHPQIATAGVVAGFVRRASERHRSVETRRLRAAVCGFTLVVASLTSMATAPPAEAAAPKLSFVNQANSVATPCGTFRFTVKIPVLTGSTRANRAAVASWARWMRKDVAAKAKDRSTCLLMGFDEFHPVAKGSVYRGRYLSVMTSWRDDMVSGLKTLNLDLKTGKTVGIGTLVSNKGNVFTRAKCSAFIAIADYGDNPCGDYYRESTPWRVSTAGVQFYAPSEDGAYVDPTVAWSKLVPANYATAAKHTTKNVPAKTTYAQIDPSLRERSTVVVQGNLVTVTKFASWYTRKVTYFGVRSDVRKKSGKWRVTVYGPDCGPWEDCSGEVTFGSRTATKAQHFDYVGYQAGLDW